MKFINPQNDKIHKLSIVELQLGSLEKKYHSNVIKPKGPSIIEGGIWWFVPSDPSLDYGVYI
jgi:hypothetical protein